MAKFHGFKHVLRLEDSKIDVNKFLTGTIYLYSKQDGSNFSAWLGDDGEIHCGSRKREVNENKDNAQSYHFFTTHPKFAELRQWLKNNPRYRIYGEWLGHMNSTDKFIGTIKDYKNGGLMLFAVLDNETGLYVPYPTYAPWFEGVYDQVVEPLAVLENPTYDDLIPYLNNHYNLPDDVTAEGIVLYNYDFVDEFGHHQICKIVNEEYLASKGTKRKNKVPRQTEGFEQEIIETYITDADIAKAQNKILITLGEGEWQGTGKEIGMLLNFVWNDLINEEMGSIVKQYKNPTISFGTLRHNCDVAVRKYLGFIQEIKWKKNSMLSRMSRTSTRIQCETLLTCLPHVSCIQVHSVIWVLRRKCAIISTLKTLGSVELV